MFILSLTLFFNSCNSQKIFQEIYSNSSLGVYTKLTIKSDSTFEYICEGCQAWDTISGYWKSKKNQLVLNSFLTKPKHYEKVFSSAFILRGFYGNGR